MRETHNIFTRIHQTFTDIFVNNKTYKYLCTDNGFTNRLYITEVNQLNIININHLNIDYNIQ